MKSVATIIIGIKLLLVLGFGLNIYKLAKCDFKPSYKAEAIRIAGIIIPPVGCIAGYLNIKDGK